MTDGEDSHRREADFIYSARAGSAFTAAFLGVMFATGAVAAVVNILRPGPWIFSLPYLSLLACLGYYRFLYRRAYLLRVADGVVSWTGFRYHGSRPMSYVELVKPSWVTPSTNGGFATAPP